MTALQDEQTVIIQNEQVGPNLFLMRLDAPGISAQALPGQFVHMKIPDREAHILRRPFSLYAADANKGTLDILYQAVGGGSTYMTSLACGREVDIIGPVGNTWTFPDATQRALLIGGGVGAAPLYMLAEKMIASRVVVDTVIGAQTKDALVCHERYDALMSTCGTNSSSTRCSTDDGSFGYAGFCTGLVKDLLEKNHYDYAAICGPEPMMKNVLGLFEGLDTACQISMEKRMACGIGACLSCIVETTDGLKRACVDGPIFDASKVVFS